MIHPFNDKGAINRLLEDYRKYENLVIGFDFDNTIFDYYNNGGDYSEVINLLKACKILGFTLCLYSIGRLDWKYKECSKLGITPDYINESPIKIEEDKDSKKPFFNILLDDRAGLESSYNILGAVVLSIINEKINNIRETLKKSTSA